MDTVEEQPVEEQTPEASEEAPPADASAEQEAAEATPEPQAEPQAVETAAPSKMKWYVVQAYSGYENKVKLSLLERIKQADMEASFGDILIPRESVQENRSGKKRTVNRNFYPGYIFVQMDLTDETWHLVKGTPKVSGFIGGRHPSPVPRREIEAIFQQVADGAAKPKPRVSFEKGDHVRVTDGPFANYTGTVESVNEKKQSVTVLINVFGRMNPVELSFAHVDKTV